MNLDPTSRATVTLYSGRAVERMKEIDDYLALGYVLVASEPLLLTFMRPARTDFRPPPEHEDKPLHWVQSDRGEPEVWSWLHGQWGRYDLTGEEAAAAAEFPSQGWMAAQNMRWLGVAAWFDQPAETATPMYEKSLGYTCWREDGPCTCPVPNARCRYAHPSGTVHPKNSA
jgi:hypothetical protein